MDGGHRLLEQESASAVAFLTQALPIPSAEFPAQPFEIFDRAEDARNASMVLGAGFEPAGKFVGGGAYFVGKEFIEQVAFAVENSCMWTEILILQDTNHKTLSALRFAWLLERQISDPRKTNVIMGDGLL